MKKILILGAPGSGKTFLSTELSKKLSIPVYHLDNYYYKSGWQVVNRDERHARQREIIKTDSWIIDGNSISTLAERLQQADMVIFLDIPLWRRMIRVIGRDCNPWVKNRNLPVGCTFSLKQFCKFFISMVVQRKDKDKKQKMLQIIVQHPQVTFVHIKSSKDFKWFFAAC